MGKANVYDVKISALYVARDFCMIQHFRSPIRLRTIASPKSRARKVTTNLLHLISATTYTLNLPIVDRLTADLGVCSSDVRSL